MPLFLQKREDHGRRERGNYVFTTLLFLLQGNRKGERDDRERIVPRRIDMNKIDRKDREKDFCREQGQDTRTSTDWKGKKFTGANLESYKKHRMAVSEIGKRRGMLTRQFVEFLWDLTEESARNKASTGNFGKKHELFSTPEGIDKVMQAHFESKWVRQQRADMFHMLEQKGRSPEEYAEQILNLGMEGRKTDKYMMLKLIGGIDDKSLAKILLREWLNQKLQGDPNIKYQTF